jgi:hypothetical protein
MNTFVENNEENFFKIIFSTIYLVRSLRNTNIKTIEYTKCIDYKNTNFINKIYANNEIIYVKNLDEKIQKKYNRNQKWRIIQFYDYNDEFMYEIEPYFENRITLNNTNKIVITSDKILSSIPEEKIVEDINTFREKYENTFLLYIIYFCFYNCIPIINKNNLKILNFILNNQILFDKLIKKIIDMNKIYFTNLNFDMNNLLPSINNIIKNIQINILKIFNIQSNELIFDLSKSKDVQKVIMTNIMDLTTNYKIQFFQKENYENSVAISDLSLFYESYDKLKIPEIPVNIKINYKIPYDRNISESKNIDIFNIFCKTFNINSDAMLSVLKYNFNASTNYLINYQSKLELKSGLTQQEQINMKIVPNFNLKELSVSTGGKKSKKNKKRNKRRISKKIYKGGLWAVEALTLAAQGVTGYIPASDVAAAIAAGCTVVAPGAAATILGGTQAILMSAPAVASATATVAVATSVPVWGPAAAIGGVILASGYGLYSYFNYDDDDSPDDRPDMMREAENIINSIKKNKELTETEIEEKQAKREEKRKAQIEAQTQADITALEPQPKQEELIAKKEAKQKARIEAREAQIAQNKAAQKQAKRDAQIAAQKQADIVSLEPQPGQEELLVKREAKADARRLANEFAWNNPPYKSTYQPISGISENPEWGISYGKSDICDSATGMCYQPELPYYSTYQPQGLPQLNTNNDFNNYNKFLPDPTGEQLSISTKDFSDFSTVLSISLLGLAGIYMFKRITRNPSSKKSQFKGNKSVDENLSSSTEEISEPNKLSSLKSYVQSSNPITSLARTTSIIGGKTLKVKRKIKKYTKKRRLNFK